MLQKYDNIYQSENDIKQPAHTGQIPSEIILNFPRFLAKSILNTPKRWKNNIVWVSYWYFGTRANYYVVASNWNFSIIPILLHK